MYLVIDSRTKSVPYLSLNPVVFCVLFFNLFKCHTSKFKEYITTHTHKKTQKCKIQSMELFGGNTSQVDVEVHLEE